MALWDAGEGVCCAYYQTGACEHTEAFDYEEAPKVQIPVHPVHQPAYVTYA